MLYEIPTQHIGRHGHSQQELIKLGIRYPVVVQQASNPNLIFICKPCNIRIAGWIQTNPQSPIHPPQHIQRHLRPRASGFKYLKRV